MKWIASAATPAGATPRLIRGACGVSPGRPFLICSVASFAAENSLSNDNTAVSVRALYLLACIASYVVRMPFHSFPAIFGIFALCHPRNRGNTGFTVFDIHAR